MRVKRLPSVVLHAQTSSIYGRAGRVGDVCHEIEQVARFGEIVLLLLAANRSDSLTILDHHAQHFALHVQGHDVEDAAEVVLVGELNWKKHSVGGAFVHGHVDALKFLRREPNFGVFCGSASTADVTISFASARHRHRFECVLSFEGAEEESTKITTLTPTAACVAAAIERCLMQFFADTRESIHGACSRHRKSWLGESTSHKTKRAAVEQGEGLGFKRVMMFVLHFGFI